jgi:diguanylate cyclase (GGDEF)-like protein
MSRALPLVLTLLLLPQHVWAQSDTELTTRILALEQEVQHHRRAAIRNGVIAGAVAVGLTLFALVRRRIDASRLSARLGMTDSLTGVKNRRYVMQTIEADCRVAARQHRTAADAGLPTPTDADLLFVLIDVDRLKLVNDRLGHLTGDRVLIHVADALQATCRTSDIVARWSGEEFLVVLRFTNRDTAAISAERLRMAVEQSVLSLDDGRTAGCTCSIGFAPYPLQPAEPDAVSWERVVALADEALQRAKQSGGNTWVGADTAQLAPV